MFDAEELLKEGSNLKNEVETLIFDCLFGLPKSAKTLTIRKKYDPQDGGSWIKVPPKDGEGIKAIKRAIEEKWGLISKEVCRVYSKEEDGDKILYIEFAGKCKTITLELNIFET